MIEEFNSLDDLKKKMLSYSLEGKENIRNKRTIVIANHSHLNDIYYAAMSMPRESVVMISSKTFFQENYRFENLINGFPIEIRYKNYTRLCMNYLKELIKSIENCILIIFPEGVYDKDEAIYKGRTGAAQLIFSLKEEGYDVDLIPMSIEKSNPEELLENKVAVKILPRIDYEKEYTDYINSPSTEEKKDALHRLTKKSMQVIATSLNREYKDEYLELFRRDFIPLPDGTLYETINKSDETYLASYEEYLKSHIKKLIKQ